MKIRVATQFGLMLVLLVASMAAQDSATAVTTTEYPSPGARQESGKADEAQVIASPFHNRKEKLSYALGVNLITGLKLQAIDVDQDLLIRGIKDALSSDQQLLASGQELAATLKTFQEERRQDVEHAKKMLAEKNKKAGEAFFAENAKKDGVITLPSGLQYKVLQKGEGQTPTLDDKVVCNYRGTLLDGTEFDSSYKRTQPATLPVKGLIKGWSEALQLMPVGSKWQLFIPPQLAYGNKVVGGIGPNAMLTFEVDLISIEKAAVAASEAPKTSEEVLSRRLANYSRSNMNGSVVNESK